MFSIDLYKKCNTSIFYIFTFYLLSINCSVIAQSIKADGTTLTQPESCSGNCTITGGLQRGANLFHSFEEFNINRDAVVMFQDPGFRNIFSRVTGSNISQILGTLGVSGGDANLFLINPNGIIFGQNSSLNVNGSFIATTADALEFGEQSLLNYSSEEIPLLTINPSALLFSRQNQGTITNNSTVDLEPLENPPFGLQVPNGKSLLLLGGNIISDGGGISGGNIQLGGLAEAGKIELNFVNASGGNITLNFTEQIKKADVFIINEANISTISPQGGQIEINAEDITVANSSAIQAFIGGNNISNIAGDISLNATQRIEIANESSLVYQVFAANQNNNADININSGSLSIYNNSFIDTSSRANANAGDINIKVPNGKIELSNNFEQIEAEINTVVGINGVGNAGNINIVAKEMLLEDDSDINASNLGLGNAGNITIETSEGIAMFSDSYILNVTNSEAIGSSGDISIDAKTLSLYSGSQITNNVNGSGEAGNISLNISDSIEIAGFSQKESFSSGIITATQNNAEGDGGDIEINTNNLRIADGAIISSQTLNDSNGGNIFIDTINFQVLNGGQIISSTDNASGNAGDITIEANHILISGRDFNFADRLTQFPNSVSNEIPGNSGVFASSRQDAAGDGGNINIEARQLDLAEDAEIAVDATGTGEAGNLNVDASNIELSNGSLTAETRRGSRGNIRIGNADSLLLFKNSQITTNASEQAKGGNIDIFSEVIALLDNSEITAKAVEGRGGNISLTSQSIFRGSDSEITAASQLGIDGTVTFDTPNVDPTSGLDELPEVPIDVASLLSQNICEVNIGTSEGTSSFVMTGRGGLPPNPYEPLDSNNVLVDVKLPQIWQEYSMQPQPVVEAAAWVVNQKGNVELVSQIPQPKSKCK